MGLPRSTPQLGYDRERFVSRIREYLGPEAQDPAPWLDDFLKVLGVVIEENNREIGKKLRSVGVDI